MEDWLTELFFAEPETPQQRYEKQVAAARARQQEAPPRTEAGRIMRSVGDQFAAPEPPWYDNPEVWANLTQEEKDIIIAYERRNPVQRRSPFEETMQGGMDAIGKMFRAPEGKTRQTEQYTPPPGGWRGPVYDRAVARTMEAEERRLDLEMDILGRLVRSLEPEGQSVYRQQGMEIPPGFETRAMPYFPEFEGESWTDPEVQRLMEERRFQQMMALRGRPLNTIPQE